MHAHLVHCVLLNRTLKAPKDAALHYRFRDQVYLNFIEQDASAGWALKSLLHDYMEDFSSGLMRRVRNALEIGGPATVKELNRKKFDEMDAQLRRFAEEPW